MYYKKNKERKLRFHSVLILQFGQYHEKAPASANQTKIGHMNIETTEHPTDKQTKQLTIVSAENLQEDLNDSIVCRQCVDGLAPKTFPIMKYNHFDQICSITVKQTIINQVICRSKYR